MLVNALRVDSCIVDITYQSEWRQALEISEYISLLMKQSKKTNKRTLHECVLAKI